MKRYILIFSLLMGAAAGRAQDLSGNVSVEADYLPTLRSHDRLASLPSTPDLSMTARPLQIAAQGVVTQINPLYTLMPATPWQASKEFSTLPGYVRFGMGSYLNITAAAGYRFIDNRTTKIGAWLEHNSTAGYKPGTVDPTNDKELKRKSFDEWIGLYGSHLFEGAGTLQADIRYHFSHFNYYHSPVDPYGTYTPFPKENLNDLKAGVSFLPVTKETGFDGALKLSDHFFGYNNRFGGPTFPAHENNLELQGFGAYKFNAESSAGLQLTANLVNYGFSAHDILLCGAPQAVAGPSKASGPYDDPEGITYGRIAATPYYSYTSSGLGIRVGARLDWTPNAGHCPEDIVSNPDFGHLHLAPDVKFSVQSGKFSGSLSATGGTELRTLASNYQLDRYQLPYLETTVPLFSPLNAKIQIEAGDFGGLSASAAVAYKVTDNLSGGRLQYVDPWDLTYYPLTYYGDLYKLKGFSLQGALCYRLADILELSGDVAYQPQNRDKGYFNGYDRARWVAGVKAGIKPIEELRIDLGYQYRGVRAVWAKRLINSEPGISHSVYEGYRLPDITDLYLNLTYAFSKRFSLWVNLDNILGTADFYGPYMPGPGITAMGGLSLLF